MTEKKDCKKSFRCTQKEGDFIKRQVESYGVSESEYIRMMVFEKSASKLFDPEVIQLLRKLEWDNLKIGTNINQVAKSCNSKRFVSGEDVKRIHQNQNLLNHKYDLMIEEILRMQNE